MFATVTFVYSKKIKIVPIKWIIDFEKAREFPKKIFFCFWSKDILKTPNYDRKYYSRDFDEEKDGLYKVVVNKLFGTMDDGLRNINTQRLALPPQKLMVTGSESELERLIPKSRVITAKKSKSNAIIHKQNKQNAANENNKFILKMIDARLPSVEINKMSVDEAYEQILQLTPESPLKVNSLVNVNNQETDIESSPRSSSHFQAEPPSPKSLEVTYHNFATTKIDDEITPQPHCSKSMSSITVNRKRNVSSIVSMSSSDSSEDDDDILTPNLSKETYMKLCLKYKKKANKYRKNNEKLMKIIINRDESRETEPDKKDQFEYGTLPTTFDFKTTLLQEALLKQIPKAKSGDIKFVNTFLLVVFGRDVLMQSSVTGTTKSENTTNKLDPTKLKFIEEQFLKRFLGEPDEKLRLASFNKIVNRKIQNLRQLEKTKNLKK